MQRSTNIGRIFKILQESGILRPRDMDAYGIPRRYLSLLYKRGLLRRTARGLYELPDSDVSEHQTLAQVSKRVPGSVVCLLSALRFHDLTSQQPHEVWIALDRSRNPILRIRDLPIRKVRFSGYAFSEGIEEYDVNGVKIRVYSAAKTIADCFKYRNKIGLDVALQALRACQRERRCSSDELWRFAKVCRVANIMRPYMEAMS